MGISRVREAAVIDLRAKRSGCRHCCCARDPANKKTWTKVHMSWLASQSIEQPERGIVFAEMMFAIRQAQERVERLEQAIRAAVPEWSLAEMITPQHDPREI